MRASFLLLLCLAALVACGDPAPLTDAGPPLDAGADAGAPLPPCDVPALLVAGTPETDALADAPARCGAPAYSWLRSPRLGEVVSRTRVAAFTARSLTTAIGAAGLTLGRPFEHDVAIDTLVYMTQDRGALVQASTALVYPVHLSERRALPTLLFEHGTSGWTTGCGPTRDTNWRLLSAALASLGYVVVSPDFLGNESAGDAYGAPPPYLVGEATALASLDAARAGLRALADLRITTCGTTDLLVYGASQGGHAALFLDRYAPYYAREFALRGVVAAVPASDFLAHTERALTAPVPATDFIAAFLATASHWYGDGARLDEVFVPPLDAQIPALLTTACDPSFPPNDPLTSEFQPALLAAASAGTFADLEPWGCITREASPRQSSTPRLGPSDPSYGILFITGESDTLLVPTIERPSYDALCAAGLPLEYLECQGAAHADGALWSIPETLDFFDARLAGVPFASACARPAASRCRGTPAAP